MFWVCSFQLSILLFSVVLSAFFFGKYMAKVFTGKKTVLSPVLVPMENFIYKCIGVDPKEDMGWKEFSCSFLAFVFIGIVASFLVQKFQEGIFWTPEKFSSLSWHERLTVAISWVTNTNWQWIKSEGSISYFTKMLGMGVQNFLSTAVGISIGVAFVNGFIRRNGEGIGNFWVYLTRSISYILLPLALVLSGFFMFQGVPNNLNAYVRAETLEGKEQIIVQGPIASQVAIKHLGGGGGFFAANAAHPYENPTPLTDLVNILITLLIAAAFPFMFGELIKDQREGWTIFVAMALLLVVVLGIVLWAEWKSGLVFEKVYLSGKISMEGKELRFGNISSAISATIATATSNGAANISYASLTPLTGLLLILNMAMGEVIFGGPGLGMVNMIFYGLLTMFLIALMIGKSPEIYGKKLVAREMVIVVITLFAPGMLQLILSAVAIHFGSLFGISTNLGSHGLTEIFYTFTSVVKNNGSSIAEIGNRSLFYNLALSGAMLFGYLLTTIPALMVAGSMVKKNISPKLARFPTANPLFVMILVSVILIISLLSFLPVLVLGPVVEHLKFAAGVLSNI